MYKFLFNIYFIIIIINNFFIYFNKKNKLIP